jgi:Mg/Co/Ni transporter MgtE
VFEELDTHHQREFLRDRPDEEAAAILGEMAPDDAADLITELDQERRAPILDLLPAEQQRKVRGLLAHNPDTAGGLMSPDLVTVSVEATVADALEAVRTSSDDLPWQAASMAFLVDGDGRLLASVSVVDLLRTAADRPLRDLVQDNVPPGSSSSSSRTSSTSASRRAGSATNGPTR